MAFTSCEAWPNLEGHHGRIVCHCEMSWCGGNFHFVRGPGSDKSEKLYYNFIVAQSILDSPIHLF